MKNRVLLFIPAYNCECQIARVLAQLDNEVLSYLDHIIVVNNRSTDQTEYAVMEYVRGHPLPLTLLRNDENYNLGGSHKVAFEYAIKNYFTHIIVLHGDDQADIHDIMPLLRSGEYQQYDSCLGARFMKGSKLEGYSTLRTVANVGFNLWFSVVCGKLVQDLGSGLNIYCVDSLKSRYYYKFSDKLFFNDVMVLAAQYYHNKILFFPITWRERDQVSNAKLFDIGCMLLKVSFSFLFGKQKFIESEMRENPISDYSYHIVQDFLDITANGQTVVLAQPDKEENTF